MSEPKTDENIHEAQREKLSGKEREIFDNRQKVYGHFSVMHRLLGQVWTAQLRARFGAIMPEIDENMVELMLAGFKILRASRPIPMAGSDQATIENYLDSYPDAKNYTSFAEDAAHRALGKK